MGTQVQADRDFWRGVLTAGGPTAVPRWTLDPMPGTSTYEATVPGEVTEALSRLADELSVPLESVVLAAHLKALAALSGEHEVVTGYVADGADEPLPCRVHTGPGPWRALLSDAHRAVSELLAHPHAPIGELRGELGLSGPLFETLFDPAEPERPGPAAARSLSGDAVLRVGCARPAGRLVLRLHHRTDVVDAECAARIGGYHLTALALIAAAPDAAHERQSLLSAEEVRLQLEGMAGPHRELPDSRVHELFEHRVRMHPDTVAAVHGERQLTYGELNSRANRLARALLARGLRPEGVVAVACERNLDWMTAVLAIFKAGGVYLPIEPHFPADRIATMLSRAECALVLSESGSTDSLDEALSALPGAQRLLVAEALREDHGDDDPGIRVEADRLAYIYFTSGSTGEPKGAMCEHAGMLNHLHAKIDDLGIGEGLVVAQTAPQCFDISLWQLVSALLAGGRTLLVEQDVILDVERFVDTIARGRVAVLQVVPSYLDAVLTYLEQHPRELPDLRCVSVTGEALKTELAQRWFAAQPHIKLVNAYGLTETSDDTNHEVMDRAPDRVLLGRPVNNVRVYIVDEDLAPVPLGAPGEIVFSGVCVGRGYVNDPDRTRLAFLPDPHRPGERLYRSGDRGRWRPGGELEFLGRADTQVKIRGFRIETGEIESTLLKVPGVQDAAVVVAEHAGRGAHLVAFYAGARPLSPDLLRERLTRSLPGYMVPSAFHWRESLPLTANSKTDKKTLTALATELDGAGQEPARDAPGTPTEQRLAAAWATVLGIEADRIGRHDHFFDRGGTSLSAVKLAIALDRAVSLKDITRHPVLADLAAMVDGRSEQRPGLLQPLLPEPDGAPGTALVCFPYAGGNAVNFQPMARALRGSGLAVYAVEFPGHDVAAEREPFAPLDQVVEQVVAELARRGVGQVLLWGHSSGAAYALETARRLEERGTDVRRVFLGAQLAGDAANRRAAVAELTGRSDTEIAAGLSADSGYTELGELDAQRAAHVGAAYRHDCVSAHDHVAAALEDPPVAKLAAPVTVVVAADDPHTAEYPHRHQDWRVFAEHVELHELAEGGHYFLRTRPNEAAAAVLRAAELLASSRVAE
ncbi:non-ribosomal peptide synthetase [Streptomyces sp. NPDC002004]